MANPLDQSFSFSQLKANFTDQELYQSDSESDESSEDSFCQSFVQTMTSDAKTSFREFHPQ